MPRLRPRPARLVTAQVDAQLPPSDAPDASLVDGVESVGELGTLTAGEADRTSPAVNPEPEIVAATRVRLDAIDADLLSGDMRDAILSAAWATHRRASLNEARTRLAADVIEHLAVDDWPAAARARADLDALDRLAEQLPATTVPEDVGMAALSDAVTLLRQRAGQITVRPPAFVIEDALWRQLPPGWRNDVDRPRPASLASDRRAVALVEELQSSGKATASSLDAVTNSLQAPTVDVLALMETCTAVAAQLRALAERAVEVESEVVRADATRSAMGATWDKPSDWSPHIAVPARTAVV